MDQSPNNAGYRLFELPSIPHWAHWLLLRASRRPRTPPCLPEETWLPKRESLGRDHAIAALPRLQDLAESSPRGIAREEG